MKKLAAASALVLAVGCGQPETELGSGPTQPDAGQLEDMSADTAADLKEIIDEPDSDILDFGTSDAGTDSGSMDADTGMTIELPGTNVSVLEVNSLEDARTKAAMIQEDPDSVYHTDQFGLVYIPGSTTSSPNNSNTPPVTSPAATIKSPLNTDVSTGELYEGFGCVLPLEGQVQLASIISTEAGLPPGDCGAECNINITNQLNDSNSQGLRIHITFRCDGVSTPQVNGQSATSLTPDNQIFVGRSSLQDEITVIPEGCFIDDVRLEAEACATLNEGLGSGYDTTGLQLLNAYQKLN